MYRFSRDLRLDDHAGLEAAASYGAIVPLLVLDAALEEHLKASPRRAAYFCAAACALDAELRERGSRLLIRRGDAAAAVMKLARESGADGAAWSAGYGAADMAADQRLQSALEEAGLRATIVHDAPALAPDETAARSASGDGYRAFAPFLDVWNDLPVVSHEHPLLVGLDSDAATYANEPLPAAAEFGSSETALRVGSQVVHRRLDDFMKHAVLRYATASIVPSDGDTSQLSAPLSFGTISARTVVAAARRRCEDPLLTTQERVSVRSFLRALAHRDFFLQLAWFHPRTDDEPLQEKMRGFTFESSHPEFDAWLTGRTGVPIVDAGMRQLHETGWMHPLVRAIAASFLCFDLGVDWRVGRACWNRLLLEDDWALATGNWQWIAAVGADMAAFPRIYNPERQRRRCDPDGSYVREWVDELRTIPTPQWRTADEGLVQLSFDLTTHNGYPRPIVNHERAARAFLARYRAHASA